MICRACLRARRALAAEALSVQRFSRPLPPSRSLSTVAVTRLRLSQTASLPCPLWLPQHLAPATRQTFSSSTARSFAPAEPNEAATPSAAPEKPSFLSDGESQVWDLLAAEFEPTQLVVQDISGGCGSMYGIDIVSKRFQGLTMLKQQRLVNAVLGDLMKDWHGVQLKTGVP